MVTPKAQPRPIIKPSIKCCLADFVASLFFFSELIIFSVDPRGFEPLTSSMPLKRASQLRHGPSSLRLLPRVNFTGGIARPEVFPRGGVDRTRTCDLFYVKEALWPTELRLLKGAVTLANKDLATGPNLHILLNPFWLFNFNLIIFFCLSNSTKDTFIYLFILSPSLFLGSALFPNFEVSLLLIRSCLVLLHG
jgi:hypothetical protein